MRMEIEKRNRTGTRLFGSEEAIESCVEGRDILGIMEIYLKI
jgi:hypothetical protein